MRYFRPTHSITSRHTGVVVAPLKLHRSSCRAIPLGVGSEEAIVLAYSGVPCDVREVAQRPTIEIPMANEGHTWMPVGDFCVQIHRYRMDIEVKSALAPDNFSGW